MPKSQTAKGKAVKATEMPDLTQVFTPELLSQAITAKRTSLKLRIIDVAAALSLSKQTIIKLEKGDPGINFTNVLKVMDYLGLSFQIKTDNLTDSVSPSAGESDDSWF